jgi:outer membrane protein TolC
MKKVALMILFLAGPFMGFGQSFDSLLKSVEQNNPRLIALQKWLEAEEVRAKTGIYPENPEVSFSYLFGNPDAIGNQQELGVMQTFRLPGYYLSKSAVQQLNFKQMQALADVERRNVIHTARSVFFRLVMLQEKAIILKSRNDDVALLVELLTQGFEAGEISRPVLDKARIHAIGVQTELQTTLSDITVQTQFLEQLNGGISIANLVFEYPAEWLIPDLEAALANLPENNPHLVMAQLNIRQSEEEIRHQRMANMPSLSAGYRSEAILDQTLQGFHVGITIPLWQNKNRLRQARLENVWAAASFSQKESELIAEVSGVYNELLALRSGYLQMQAVLDKEQVSSGNLELLRAGHISFTEYLVNADLIWDARTRFFQAENDYFVLLSKLKSLL